MATGIYKITSPSGKVYIGQSWNFKQRFQFYLTLKCVDQTKLFHSFLKYGVASHVFEIIQELPPDVEQPILDIYEQLYMDLYRDAGVILLNLREAGSKGKLAAETLAKMSAANIGKKMSDQMKRKTSERMKGKKTALGSKHTEEWKLRASINHKGKQHRLGVKDSLEVNMAKSLRMMGNKNSLGHKQTDEDKLKKSLARKLYWENKKLNHGR